MSISIDTTTEIRPFNVEISQAQIDNLRRRMEATRWPATELAAIDALDTGIRRGPEPDTITLETYGREIPEP